MIYNQRVQDKRLIELETQVDTLINAEIEKLQNLANDELKMRQIAINREIESRTVISYKTEINNYYMKHRLVRPVNYIIIQKGYQGKNWIIGVACPINLNCGSNVQIYSKFKIIGFGSHKIRKNAENLAAQNALIFLKNIIG